MPRPVVLRPPLEYSAEEEQPVERINLRLPPLEESDEPLPPVRLSRDLESAPSRANAQANHEFLVVKCRKCQHSAELRLETIRGPDEMSFDDLVARLRCTRCHRKGSPSATIVGLKKGAPTFRR
jgi:ribosomal protein L40E